MENERSPEPGREPFTRGSPLRGLPGPRPPGRGLRVAVVGAGIAGLTLAHRLLGYAEVTVFEAAPRPGGHVVTVREDGFLVEGGPSAFLDRASGPRHLACELGLEDEWIPAPPAARRRLVYHGGRLRPVPDSLGSLLTSGLLSPFGSLRVLLEPFVPRLRTRKEETVAEFARRRIGGEAAELLVDAAVAGSIAAGDSRLLSLPAAFPGLARIEHDRQSLLRALGGGRRTNGNPEPRLIGLRTGMARLVDGLAGALGPRLLTGTRVERVEPEPGTGERGWRIGLAGGSVRTADRVALSLPAREAARVIERADPDLARFLATRPFVGIAVVALAFRASDLPRPLDGFGYLVARRERMSTLGVVFDSAMFPGRAPEGFVLVRALLGGSRHPDVVTLPAAKRIDLAARELERVLGITAPPVHAWTFSWPEAIPQYVPGHREGVAAARLSATRHPGLVLCGTSYDGISLETAVESGRAHADAILAGVE
jgi:oxygen-dependent protoporphyrinogen oxidase